MRVSAQRVVAAHAALGSSSDVVRDRRVLFRAIASVVGSPLATTDDDVIDNPLVRRSLGAAFAGSGSVPRDGQIASSELVADGCAGEVSGMVVRLASAADAPRLLASATERVQRALRGHDDQRSDPLVVTLERAREAFPVLIAGLRLAFEAVPELAADLLPHVTLFVMTDRARSGRLGSASDRDHPGLLLLPEPTTPLEVAEAFVHEGAHLKFFDLAVTHELLADGYWNAPTFRPSWAASIAPPWPAEQTFAAWHAYTCLAVMADAGVAGAAGSLLSVSAARAAEIGEELLASSRVLGRDGRQFVGSVMGRFPDCPPTPPGPDEHGSILSVHRSGERELLVRAGSPPGLVWTRPDLAQTTL